MTYISLTNDKNSSIIIQMELHPDLNTVLSEVAGEMGLTREELVIKILQRWKNEMRVNIGKTGQLCHICDENMKEP